MPSTVGDLHRPNSAARTYHRSADLQVGAEATLWMILGREVKGQPDGQETAANALLRMMAHPGGTSEGMGHTVTERIIEATETGILETNPMSEIGI